MQPARIEHWRHLVEIVALIAAAIWAFYVFVYQEKIKPASEPARLQFSSSVAHEQLQGGKELVTISLTVKNTSAEDAALAILCLNAYGVRYKSESASGDIRPAEGITILNRGLASEAPMLLYSHLNVWEPLGGHSQLRLPPAEDLTFSESFVLKNHAYDTIRLKYAYCYQRNDDAAVTKIAPTRMGDGGFDIRALLRLTGVHEGLRCGGTLNYQGESAL